MIEVLNPTAGPATGKVVMAKRAGTLNGLRVGVIWNGRPYGDKVIKAVIGLLRQKYSFETVVFLKKPFIGNVAPTSMQEQIIDSCDVAITGIGD